MKVNHVPFTQGFRWVRQGMSLALQQPMGFVGLLGLMLLAALALLLVPLLGVLVLLGLMPLFWLLFMQASQQAQRSERINPWALFAMVREDLQRKDQAKQWLVLGLLYAVATFVLMLLANLAGPDVSVLVEAAEKASEGPSDGLWQNPAFVESLIWRMGLTWPLSLVFWHTPALLFWGKVPAVKAVFFSMVISWRNLGAFVAYALGWAAALLALSLPLQWLSAGMGAGLWLQGLSIAAGLWVVSAFYASLSATVFDCVTLTADDTSASGPTQTDR